MKRRKFMQTASAAGLALYIPKLGNTEDLKINQNKNSVPRRPLGKTGRELSIIGFGGIVVMNVEQSDANRIVAESVESGVNYFDVAPTYGNAQDRLGPALEPFRSEVFLACKTTRRDKAGAEQELHESLKKMRTDHFDLYQLHALAKMEDWEQASGPGGALETYMEAKKKGLIRLIGFSAHSVEVALKALDQFDFDTILFPFNFVTWHQANFGPQVLAKAKEKGTARLALKALAKCPWPKDADKTGYEKCWYQPASDPKEAALALRFTLSQDITAAVTPGEASLLRLAIKIARDFKPLEPSENEEVITLAKGLTPIFKLSL